MDVPAETQRTVEGIASCTNLLERLSRYACRLARHPEQEQAEDITKSLEELTGKLRSIERTSRGCLKRLAMHAVEETTESTTETQRKALQPRDMPGECVLSGLSPGVSIPTVLAFLGSHHQTGTLLVRTTHENFTLVLVDGDVIHAESDQPPTEERLGEILVSRGVIEAEQLTTFLENHTDGVIGEAMEREELVDAGDMQDALRQQVQQLFHRIFAAQQAGFYFYTGDSPVPELRVRMRTIELLLESARTEDEADFETSLSEATALLDESADDSDSGGDDAEPSVSGLDLLDR